MFYNVYSSLCDERGLAPYKLAMELGAKNNSIVASWKKGGTPRGEMLSKIAAYFDVPVEYLLTGDEHYRQKEKQPTSEDGLDDWDQAMLSTCRGLSEEDRQLVLRTAQALLAAHALHPSTGDK